MSLLFKGSDWDEKTIYKIWKSVDKIGQSYGLDYYQPQIEIISSEQMIDNYSTHAIPTMYNHWSFGKTFVKDMELYKKGMKGLAFEVVINSNPSICYVMDNNTALMQTLVIAHAAVGHSSFFKTNYLYRDRTDAKYILPFLSEARKYIQECEQLYGERLVESLLDVCHTLSFNSVTFNTLKKPKSAKQKRTQLLDRIENDRLNANLVFDTLIKREELSIKEESSTVETTNLLAFFETYSKRLKPWERKIISIVRYVAEYFYPQMLEKVSNEGWATFWHYNILHDLFNTGQLTPGHMLEFYDNHSAVVAQSRMIDRKLTQEELVYLGQLTKKDIYLPNKYYHGINVYTLGFNIYQDIRRMSENPTEEDKLLFPHIAGGDWLENVKYAMENFQDDGFINQYLSPEVARKMKLATLKPKDPVEKIHLPLFQTVGSNESIEAFNHTRKTLANSYSYSNMLPTVELVAEPKKKLVLRYVKNGDKLLDKKSAQDIAFMIRNRLWDDGLELDFSTTEDEE